MATKKDLVEAYSFSRRRLVTAFVSGAPGGREVEPARPGRTIVGGIALAVLLAAGAAVLGILKSPTVVDWDKELLVSDKDTGADYVNIAPREGADLELRPVTNVTSAMLLLGADVEAVNVPREEVESRRPGERIGILQAPETPPETGNLVSSGWTACTSSQVDEPGGIKVTVQEGGAVEPTPDAGFVVRTEKGGGTLYLIAESQVGGEETRAYAYPVPDQDRRSSLLQNVVDGVSEGDAVTVPDDFLNLFPAGGALSLDTFGLTQRDIGARPNDPGRLGVRARVGDVLSVGEQKFLVRPDDAIALDTFADAVYENLTFTRRQPGHPEADQSPEGEVDDAGKLPGASWPQPAEPLQEPSGELCAVLDAGEGRAPAALLASATLDDDAYADDVAAGANEPDVEPGHGALVRPGDWSGTDNGTLVLVDDRGVAYPVAADGAAENLGYADAPDVVVPESWVQLFSPGVPLSVQAARCPPTSDPRETPCG